MKPGPSTLPAKQIVFFDQVPIDSLQSEVLTSELGRASHPLGFSLDSPVSMAAGKVHVVPCPRCSGGDVLPALLPVSFCPGPFVACQLL